MPEGAEPARPPGARRRPTGLFDAAVVATLVAGTALSLAGYLAVRNQGRAAQERAFQDLAAARAQAVERRAASAVDRIRASAAYLGTTSDLDDDDYAALRPSFRLYTSAVVGGAPDLAAIAWVPRIAGPDRASFLRNARPTDGTFFDVTELGPGGTMIPAAERPEYYPIAVVGPLPPLPLRGADLGVNQDLRERMDSALASSLVIAEPAARALPRVTPGLAVMVLVPVRPTSTIDAHDTPGIGFALGLVDVAALVREALVGLPVADIQLTLTDLATGTPLYRLAPQPGNASDQGPGFERTSSLTVGDLRWSLAVRAGPTFPATPGGLGAPLVLAVGLVLTVGGAVSLRRVAIAQRRRDRIAEERREAAANLRSIFDASLDAIVSADDYGRISGWNASAERMFGWRFDEVAGRTLADTIIPGWDREPHLQALRTLRDTGGSSLSRQLIEYRMTRRDGTELPVELMMAPTRQHGVLTVTAFIRDITDRKEAEKALRRSHADLEDRVRDRTAELEQATERLAERERHLRMIMENAGDAVFVSDGSGRILEGNRRAAAMLGYEPEELLSLHLWDIETRTDPARPIGPRLEALPLGEVMTSQGEHRRKDGSVFPVEVRVGPIELGEKRVYLALARDVTERRAIEEALAAARDAAVEASRLKSDFLANMSHEIRTPLNGILGMTSLLLDSPLSPTQREDLETLDQSAQHLLVLINDILDLARIEAGRFHLDAAPFDVEEVMSGVGGLLAAGAERKGIELIIRVAPETPRSVVGDAARLRQVLLNLAGNAVKFTDKGHVLLEVECRRRTDKEAVLRFAVSDSGIGIQPEDLDRVFEKFTQVDPSPGRRHGGTGLGLAISRQLVDAMGGVVEASSRPGVGSEFWFSIALPIAEGRAERRTASLEQVRVLVVDDSPVNRRILHEQLLSWRLRPTSVSNAAAAVETVDRAVRTGDPYRIVLLDDDMAETTGLELARTLRAGLGPKTPLVLLLSSIGRHLDHATVAAAGIARWLTKPVGPSELLDALTEAWEGHGAEPEASQQREESIGARVLLAEDSPVNQRVALRMLEKLACAVDVADEGSVAVERAARGRYDLILMDCQMPGMDGYEATRRIRRAESGTDRHTPIVALTAHAMPGDRERCIEAGMDDYLSKPVALHDLATMLRRYTGSGGSPPAASVPGAQGNALVDADHLLRDIDRDPALLAELTRLFSLQSESNLKTLREAIAAGSADDVRRAAHALKGSLLTMRARATPAAEMETTGARGDVPGAAALLDPLTEHVHAVYRVLEEMTRTLGPEPEGTR